MSGTQSKSNHDPLRVLADALAPYLADRLQVPAATGPMFYSQADSPLGRRRHLALVRRKVLEGKKVGRLVLVTRQDVHAYIAAQGARAVPESEREALADWGLEPRGAR